MNKLAQILEDLDTIASEIESFNPYVALSIDKVSDMLEGKTAGVGDFLQKLKALVTTPEGKKIREDFLAKFRSLPSKGQAKKILEEEYSKQDFGKALSDIKALNEALQKIREEPSYVHEYYKERDQKILKQAFDLIALLKKLKDSKILSAILALDPGIDLSKITTDTVLKLLK